VAVAYLASNSQFVASLFVVQRNCRRKKSMACFTK